MKKIILFLTLFMTTLFGEDYLDLSIETKTNYRFEDYYFKDFNITKPEKLSKFVSFNELKLSGNFNSIIGFNYSKNMIVKPDNYETKEIYIGSDKTKFLGYQKDDTKIPYGTRVNSTKTTKYTIYDIFTIEKNELNSIGMETFSPLTVDNNVTDLVYRTMTYDKYILSSENLYNHVKENALDGESYFYGVSGALSKSIFRMYGVAIASYEQHDYSKGTANYNSDLNGSQPIMLPETGGSISKQMVTDGRFKGFGYGYKITAEAYWKDLSLFVTTYMKKTKLKNYYQGGNLTNIILEPELKFEQKYTSFGLRYRF